MMQPIFMLLLIAGFANAQAFDATQSDVEKFETYADAYRVSVDSKRPMLILLTAKWCAPCRAFKADVLEPMRLRNEFKPFVFVEIDIDGDPANAKQVMDEIRVPQLVILSSMLDRPEREFGSISRERVIGFLRRVRSRIESKPLRRLWE